MSNIYPLFWKPSSLMSKCETIEIVKSVFSDFNVNKIEQVQDLWSGYGEISRFKIARDKHSCHYCILKYINFTKQKQHPRGWQSDFSHNRKLQSYINEQLFYQNFAHHLPKSCKIPELKATGKSDRNLWLIMEDLDQIGLDERITPRFVLKDQSLATGYAAVAKNINKPFLQKRLKEDEYLVKVFGAARWLASFHAYFLNTPFDNFEQPGTYWHLGTRPHELETMPNSPLKKSAEKIDNILEHANYQTLVHGDAKIANFCFNPSIETSYPQISVAAVDFQYVGRGAGIKDLIYLLGSCFDSNGLNKHSNAVEELYFEKLKQHLIKTYSWPMDNCVNLTNEWKRLIPFAWADFERFLVGWASDHVKLNEYSSEQTNKALRLINKSNS